MMDGAAHAIHAYGIDAEGGNNPELSNSPRTLSCTPTETGVLRHVINPTSYGAWGFSGFMDVRPVPDATMSGWSRGDDWPTTPQLIQGTGAPEVWLVDGPFRRHVISPDSASDWHLNLATGVQQLPLAQVLAMPQGPDLDSVRRWSRAADRRLMSSMFLFRRCPRPTRGIPGLRKTQGSRMPERLQTMRVWTSERLRMAGLVPDRRCRVRPGSPTPVGRKGRSPMLETPSPRMPGPGRAPAPTPTTSLTGKVPSAAGSSGGCQDVGGPTSFFALALALGALSRRSRRSNLL